MSPLTGINPIVLKTVAITTAIGIGISLIENDRPLSRKAIVAISAVAGAAIACIGLQYGSLVALGVAVGGILGSNGFDATLASPPNKEKIKKEWLNFAGGLIIGSAVGYALELSPLLRIVTTIFLLG